MCLNPAFLLGPSGFQLANEELCTRHKNSAKAETDFSSVWNIDRVLAGEHKPVYPKYA